MVIGFLLTGINALVLMLLSILQQQVGRRHLPVIHIYALANVFALVLTIILVGRAPGALHLASCPPRFVLVMAIAGCCNATGMCASMYAMRYGHAAVTTVICQSSMIVPLLFSTVAWHEPLTLFRILGVAGMVVMFVLVGADAGADRETNLPRWAASLLVAFLCFGVTQVAYLTPSHWAGVERLAPLRVPLFLLSSTTIMGIAALGMRARIMLDRTTIGYAGGLALTTLVSLFLVGAAADHLAPVKLSGLVYPVTLAANTVLFCLYSRLISRERYTPHRWAGIALGVLGVMLCCR